LDVLELGVDVLGFGFGVLEFGVDEGEFEMEVTTNEELVDSALGALDVSAGGGMTLKLTLAPHSASVDPEGQQPASVQYVLAGQNSM
jgi:hypothetical protein